MSEISKHTRHMLHEALADATILVWKIQNALTENPDADAALIEELSLYAEALAHQSLVISGAISRWQLAMKMEQGRETH